jgi:hypothetical protein
MAVALKRKRIDADDSVTAELTKRNLHTLSPDQLYVTIAVDQRLHTHGCACFSQCDPTSFIKFYIKLTEAPDLSEFIDVIAADTTKKAACKVASAFTEIAPHSPDAALFFTILQIALERNHVALFTQLVAAGIAHSRFSQDMTSSTAFQLCINTIAQHLKSQHVATAMRDIVRITSVNSILSPVSLCLYMSIPEVSKSAVLSELSYNPKIEITAFMCIARALHHNPLAGDFIASLIRHRSLIVSQLSIPHKVKVCMLVSSQDRIDSIPHRPVSVDLIQTLRAPAHTGQSVFSTLSSVLPDLSDNGKSIISIQNAHILLHFLYSVNPGAQSVCETIYDDNGITTDVFQLSPFILDLIVVVILATFIPVVDIESHEVVRLLTIKEFLRIKRVCNIIHP